ncbi:homeobox protein caupolican-like protein [Lasius niger]|uniref:Homeobox protein caupolican-like protein n=1 Tax=Lasius niger TaxID=67767 RepID=A0A0J7K507_LASNI|nr:homeobox protein caupolican-like protein [Lasius niger]
MMTDPVTGQTVCSCQYDSAARLALGTYPRLGPTAGSYSSYPTPTPSTTDQGPYPSIGMDSSAFYPPLQVVLEIVISETFRNYSILSQSTRSVDLL